MPLRPESHFDQYDSSVQLVRLLCLAVEALGGELEIPEEALTGRSHADYAITLTDPSFEKNTRKIKVRRIRKEVGEVLDVSGLQEASYVEDRDKDGTVWRIFKGDANGVHVELATTDTTRRYWVSPIFTMRTQGVALVSESGILATHEVVQR